jgi:hypothetical protein
MRIDPPQLMNGTNQGRFAQGRLVRHIRAALMMLTITVITATSAVPTGRAYDLSNSPWRDQNAVADLGVDGADLRDTDQLTRSEWLAALGGAVQVWDDAAQTEHLPVHLRVVLDDPDAEIYIQLTDHNYVRVRRPDSEPGLTLPLPVCGVLNFLDDCAWVMPFATPATLGGVPRRRVSRSTAPSSRCR